MTLLKALQSHKGGLLQLKTELYWYDRGGWDNNPGRVCLLLDVAASTHRHRGSAWAQVAGTTATDPRAGVPVDAFLLIDGQPHWVWVAEEDIERL